MRKIENVKRIYLTDHQRGIFKREGAVSFLARTGLSRGGAGAVICGDEYLVAESYEELRMDAGGEYGQAHKGWKDRSKVEAGHLRLRCRVVSCRVVELDAERVPVMSREEWSACGVEWVGSYVVDKEGQERWDEDYSGRVYCRRYAKSVLRDDRRKGELDKDLVLIKIMRVGNGEDRE